MDKNVKNFMKRIGEMPDFDRVKFVILFGSQANGKANSMSDYDFAVYYDGDEKQRFDFQIGMSSDENFDVKIFQDLPLYVQKEVLKGKVVYCKDVDFVYDVAYEIIKRFEDFKKYYYDYVSMRRLKVK